MTCDAITQSTGTSIAERVCELTVGPDDIDVNHLADIGIVGVLGVQRRRLGVVDVEHVCVGPIDDRMVQRPDLEARS